MLAQILAIYATVSVVDGQIGYPPHFDPPPIRSASAPPAPQIPNHPTGMLPPPMMDGSARLFLGATLSEVQAIIGAAPPLRESAGDSVRYHGAACDILIDFTNGRVSSALAMTADSKLPTDLLGCLESIQGRSP